MLELQTPFASVIASSHDDERCEESERLKLFGELVGVPYLSVLFFQCRSASRFKVEFSDTLPTKLFGGIRHGSFFQFELLIAPLRFLVQPNLKLGFDANRLARHAAIGATTPSL